MILFRAGKPWLRDKIGADSHLVSIMLDLKINGESRQIAESSSVLNLLESMSLVGKRVAVERNGEIVPKGLHASTMLADGDVLEIVVAVGGG